MHPPIKPNHKALKAYYEALQSYARQEVQHETALRSAFQNLLEQLGRQYGWTLIPELSAGTMYSWSAAGKAIRPDGTFRDDYYITRGHWEADDPEYIVRLVGQVVRASVETVEIVNGLPAEFGGGDRQ